MSVKANTAEVIIVGAGLMGTSVAHALAGRGVRDIVVLERDYVAAGATGKSSGVIRCHYGVPSLAYMAWRSLETFQYAEDILGDSVGYVQSGYLVAVGKENVPALEANVRMQQRLGIDTHLLSPEEAQKLWPEADLSDIYALAYEPQGGYADPTMTAQAYARAAREQGVQIRQGQAVIRLLTSKDGSKIIGVETQGQGIIYAPLVIVAAGVWSHKVMATVGIDVPVRPQRAQLVVIDPGKNLGSVPVFSDLVNLQYIRPEQSGHLLVGNSDHGHPEFVDADNYAQHVDADHVEVMTDKFLSRFSSLENAAFVSGYSGAYEVTPDYNPIMSTTPLQGAYVCTGFSGHGFKLTPMVGTLMTNLVLGGYTPDSEVNLYPFRLNRFEQGEALISEHQYEGAGQLR